MDYVEIELTQGNINNSHLYLSSVADFFPDSAFGGPNDSMVASLLLEIHNGVSEPVKTDIAEDKKIFRKRTWVREFFETHQLKAGDSVIIQKTGANRYHVYPKLA